MEYLSGNDITTLSNPGVASRQLLSPTNSSSERLTITEVHLDPNASQPRHTHASSEQVWYGLSGTGTLLLANDAERPFAAGDVVRFEEGDVHGLRNDADDEFIYLSVTAPPIDFGYAYRTKS